MKADAVAPGAIERVGEHDRFVDHRPRRLDVAALDVCDEAIEQHRLIQRAIRRAGKTHDDLDAVADLIVAVHAGCDRPLTDEGDNLGRGSCSGSMGPILLLRKG